LSTDLRSVEAKVAEARTRETIATAEATAARQEREQAERNLGPARRAAQLTANDVANDITARLNRLEGQLDRAIATAKDAARPDPSIRLRARVFLHGGGETATGDDPRTPASTLLSLTTLDVACGQFFEVSRVGGTLMQLVFDQGADESLAARADELECRGWAGLMARIKTLAGES
jgi:hypothetical protein